MKTRDSIRILLSFLLLFAMLSPTAAMAMGDGKKYFKQGMKHEVAEEWDKAVEQFALAVNDNPKNPEYRLHLQRSLFRASQMFMMKGAAAAKEGDYVGGYNAFRRAYAFDPTNELAKSELERMVRLQKEANGESVTDDSAGAVKLVPASYQERDLPQDVQLPQRMETLRDLPFESGIPLHTIVRDLAKELDLNVLFDKDSQLDSRIVKIVLKQVTPAKALDYIFLQEGLFFQKVGPRTVLVATTNRRMQLQQLVLRTFYLSNADPKTVVKVLQTAIPAQQGRSQTIALIDEETNSITVRDTSENIKLMGKLITSLDKDRAEVVMDVAIYEVSKSDLLKFGNQIGNETQLSTLGGTTRGVLNAGENDFGKIGRAVAEILPRAFGVGFAIPAANFIAFQNKGDTKLLASTQIHAFNNQDSSARIGQRVPVRTATFQTGNQVGSGGIVSDVINYEQVGLTLKFKPIVFPNQDVQVAMEIESKDVVAGGTDSNPIFSERTIKGTARVHNNKTLLLASVAQDVESRGRQGIPLLGLIPILGRLFTAPTRDNRQVDIVIAITPRVIRAPAILPEDVVERPTGSVTVPTTGSLEAMIIQEEREELLAASRRMPNVAHVQLPDQKVEVPGYVRTSGTVAATSEPSSNGDVGAPILPVQSPAVNLLPIDGSMKTLKINPTALNAATAEGAVEPAAVPVENIAIAPVAEIAMGSSLPEMKPGERAKILVSVKSTSAFRSALLGVKFDSKKLAVRSVQLGDVFGAQLVNSQVTPFLNQNGKMYVSLNANDALTSPTGVLAYIEVEALEAGKPEMIFDRDVLNLLTPEGKNFSISF
ncbi:MAG: secretin N-terminal domain-containing protein [Pyrinomonadaceae bacterium]